MVSCLRAFCGFVAALLLCECAAATSPVHRRRAHHIRRVSLVFSWHLDVGFNAWPGEPGFDNTVISLHLNEHFPNAARLAQQLRQRQGGEERLVVLTHSWIVSLFLDCPARIGIRCPNATTVQEVTAAIRRGDITWHALPHNAQVELYDADLLRYGVQLGRSLDRAFGLPPKAAASQRDVPGLTRAAVPILADEGVKAITVGVNGGSAPPAVPFNTPFIWRDPPSGKQLLAMWHPGGYSGVPVDGRDECVQVEGLHHALCFAWRGDNDGPPESVDEVLDIFNRTRHAFPRALVEAAGLEGFVADLAEAAPRLDLPVVTAEIGDTWIYGVASDPAKLSEYRALLRMRTASRERYDDEAFQRFSRLLLKLPEHTWGVDTKQWPGDYDNWSNEDFRQQLENRSASNPFSIAVESWVRQRAYSLWAVQELGSSPAGVAAWQALAALQDGKAPPAPGAANSSFKRVGLQQPLVFESPVWQLELSNMTGAIVGLRFKGTSASSSMRGVHSGRGGSGGSSRGRWPWQPLLSWLRLPGWGAEPSQAASGCGGGDAPSWAGFDAPLALPVYETFSEEDYGVIWGQYAYQAPDLQPWFLKDFGKPNATAKGRARRAVYLPQATGVWWKRGDGGALHIVVKAAFDSFAVLHAGAPAAIWTEIRMPADSGEELQLDLTWEGKTPTRLPEAFWLRWTPVQGAVDASSWRVFKLGQPISPLEVLRNGSQAQHAVGDEGVAVDSADGRRRLRIRSLDAALVSPGRPTPFPSLRDPPDLSHGMAHCLANNIWGTNYVMHFPYQLADANMRFRFLLQQEDLQQPGAWPPYAPAAAAA